MSILRETNLLFYEIQGVTGPNNKLVKLLKEWILDGISKVRRRDASM